MCLLQRRLQRKKHKGKSLRMHGRRGAWKTAFRVPTSPRTKGKKGKAEELEEEEEEEAAAAAAAAEAEAEAVVREEERAHTVGPLVDERVALQALSMARERTSLCHFCIVSLSWILSCVQTRFVGAMVVFVRGVTSNSCPCTTIVS